MGAASVIRLIPAAVYPEPASVMAIAVTFPFVNVAVPVAPVPSP